VKVRIVEGTGELLSQLVNSGEIDFAVGSARGGKGLRARKLLDIPEFLISSAAAGQGAKQSTDSQANRPIDLVLPTLTRNRRATIFACLEAHEIAVSSEVEVDSALAILDLVNRSGWTTVGPSVTMDPVVDGARYSFRPLVNPGLSFSVFHIASAARTLPPEAQSFVDLLVEEMQQLVDTWARTFRHP
jgi:DNA-binding transcriptional LysR family regulator